MCIIQVGKNIMRKSKEEHPEKNPLNKLPEGKLLKRNSNGRIDSWKTALSNLQRGFPDYLKRVNGIDPSELPPENNLFKGLVMILKTK